MSSTASRSSDRARALERILALEDEQGYENNAVMGGIAAFLDSWGRSLQSSNSTDEERRLLAWLNQELGGYAALNPAQRRLMAHRVLRKLADDQPSSAEQQQSRRVAPQPAPAEQPPQRKATKSRPSATTLDSPATAVSGIGPKLADSLTRLDIHTVRDLLYHLPRRHDAYPHSVVRDALLGQKVTLSVSVGELRVNNTRQRIPIATTLLSDDTGSIRATWFGNRYIARQLEPGQLIRVSGEVSEYKGQVGLQSPAWEPLEQQPIHTGEFVPVYPLTEGLTAGKFRRIMHDMVQTWVVRVHDPLTEQERTDFGLMDLRTALQEAHFASSAEALAAARQRLCVDEFLALQVGLLERRRQRDQQPGRALFIDQARIECYVQNLPFVLTEAQNRAVEAILADMARPHPMRRMLQGDVGSGKTAVAVAAALAAVSAGTQVAIMAPTSILAEQHYATISALLDHDEVRIELLTGSLPETEKQRIRDLTASGQVDLLIGTHALIQESVSFADLGLAIVDEEHRFGVAQRARLMDAELQPHMLQMSATPIPRSLAMTVYGDVDVSVLDELPAGRKPVVTALRDSGARDGIYQFIRKEVECGHQVFVVCPLVEPDEDGSGVAATSEQQRLQRDIFPDLRVGLVHGRLNAADKEAVMASFAATEYDILVATTVIEVGIDIPNATVMLVENAERFGLAQLHQLRGRVGRGTATSYCILMSDDPSETSLRRLEAMVSSNDGFELAELDLELRGPGDFFGVRQSGLPALRVADLSDMRSLEIARQLAAQVYETDPGLRSEEHRLLRREVKRFWARAPKE